MFSPWIVISSRSSTIAFRLFSYCISEVLYYAVTDRVQVAWMVPSDVVLEAEKSLLFVKKLISQHRKEKRKEQIF